MVGENRLRRFSGPAPDAGARRVEHVFERWSAQIRRWLWFAIRALLVMALLRPTLAHAAELAGPGNMLLGLPMLCSAVLSFLMLMHPRTRRVLWKGLAIFAVYLVFLLLLFSADLWVRLGVVEGVMWIICPWVLFLLLACGLITLP